MRSGWPKQLLELHWSLKLSVFVLLFQACLSDVHRLAEEAHTRKHAVMLENSRPNSALDAAVLESQPEDKRMRVADVHAQRYSCALPTSDEERSEHEDDVQDGEGEDETGDERSSALMQSLLDQLSDRCFYTNEGWWTYELCYKRQVRQMHIEDNVIQTAFLLGTFDEEGTASMFANSSLPFKDERTAKGDVRYTAQLMTGGTQCDMADVSRSAEVRFLCNQHSERSFISSVREPETCQYVIKFTTPVLCEHPAFQSGKHDVHTIQCTAFTPPEEADARVAETKMAEAPPGAAPSAAHIDEL